MEVGKLLQEKLPMFAQSSNLEVQERVSIPLVLIFDLMRKEIFIIFSESLHQCL